MNKLTLIAFIFLTTNCLSQNLSNYENRKSTRTNKEFITFHVEEPQEKKKHQHYNANKEYFWYKSQEVKQTQGGSAGLLLHGLYERFYINKQIAAKGQFRKGLKHGRWMYWNEDGKIIGFEKYRRGKLIHKEEINPLTGKPEMVVQRGWNHLIYKTSNQIIKTNKDSTKVVVETKDENGNKKSKERFLYGELHGKQIYFENGKKRKESFKHGINIDNRKKNEEKEEPNENQNDTEGEVENTSSNAEKKGEETNASLKEEKEEKSRFSLFKRKKGKKVESEENND
jgi:antitoxin component YwqK of YwqJK toxin-antitoxin module